MGLGLGTETCGVVAVAEAGVLELGVCVLAFWNEPFVVRLRPVRRTVAGQSLNCVRQVADRE